MKRRRLFAILGALGLGSIALSALAEAPVLHEFLEPNPEEDLVLGATTPDGRMPAAARTPSGVIRAPSFGSTSPRQIAYGGSATPDSIDATYRIDRDTSQPDTVRYDDPFTPAVAPFKRLYAFDAADENLELRVADKTLKPVSIGGELRATEDHFFGDLFVDVTPGVPVRIPSVGPGTRLLALRVEPHAKLEIVRDGAENLFAIGAERRRLRLILELAAPRAVFGSEFPEVSYASLEPHASPLPAQARPVVSEVLARLGLSRAVPPRAAIAALVAHFRGFTPSTELPSASHGPELYRELALAKKGVCRHRAYAFVLSAMGLGIPARFVRNEAHAWVEVGDGRLYHRIDLGGAAGRFDLATREGSPPHAVPPDPYAWPEGGESGLARANQGLIPTQDNQTGPTDPFPSPGAPSPIGSGRRFSSPSDSDSSRDSVTQPSEPAPDRPRSEVELEVALDEARRGTPLRVQGRVKSGSVVCPNARVDITLLGERGELLIGSVPTDGAGRFDSRVTIPFDIEVGDYTLRAWTPGAGECGASD